MSISLQNLCKELEPTKTALLLGAGASVPSGGPTGEQLAATLWRELEHCEPESRDLTETATILERRHGREQIVRVVATALKRLRPTGGLTSIPDFPWLSLFTTNFDQLIEQAYKRAHKSLVVMRSNYDLSNRDQSAPEVLYKLHGCITQDRSLGDKPSMLLTEDDYENHSSFRQSIFSKLSDALLSNDILVIGNSLRDKHLNDEVKNVLRVKREGAVGRVFVLAYEQDDLRAPVLEDRGATVAFGGIDEFIHALSTKKVLGESFSPESSGSGLRLPPLLASATIEVAHAKSLPSNVVRMFNGGPATYADIQAGFTFSRSGTDGASSELQGSDKPILVITGAAGVGKTSFARQIAYSLSSTDFYCWEHNPDFPLDHEQWIRVEGELRSAGRRGLLLLDECTHYMRSVNLLAEHVSKPDSKLRIIVTAHSAHWVPRVKSPVFFKSGVTVTLGHLENTEIYSLVNLVEHNANIAALVHASFKSQSRERQILALQRKASADMFVCLKNIFANETLDVILLREFDELNDQLREYYRYVAALESVGMRVHRHLLIRMLGINADAVSAALGGLIGIVDEYDIKPRDGIYGWRTRHLVIARKITEYKFSGVQDLIDLFHLIIENLTPAIQIERLSISSLCDNEYGIGSVADPDERIKLYRKLIGLAPGERVPWHRLIRELLSDGRPLDDAEYAIRDARAAVGGDAPIDRYSVRLLIARAERTKGLAKEDRIALFRRAYETALRNLNFHQQDRYSYAVLFEAARCLAQEGVDRYLMDEAVNIVRQGCQVICDPEMERDLRRFEMECGRRE